MNYHTIIVRGENIRYIQIGAGTTILFLHGYGIPLKYLETYFRLLGQKYTIIAPEIFGFNNLRNPPTTLHDSAILAKEFCNALGIEPTIVIWESIGWWIALEMAKTDRRILQVVLMNPIFPITYWRVGFIFRGIYKHFRAMTGITGGIHGVKFGFSHFFPFLFNFFRKLRCSMKPIDDIKKFSLESYHIDQSVFLLCGEKDEFFDVRKNIDILRSNKKINYEIYPKLSHDWPIFYQDYAVERILSVLQREF